MSYNVGKMSGNVGKLKFHIYVFYGYGHFRLLTSFFQVEVILCGLNESQRISISVQLVSMNLSVRPVGSN